MKAAKLKKNKANISAAELLFYFYIIIWWLEIGTRISFLKAIRIEFIVGAILTILSIVRISNNNLKIYESPIFKSCIIYLVVMFGSVVFSVDFAYSWDVYFNRILKFSMMAFFMSAFINTASHLRLYLLSSFVAFFKVGFEALHGKITGSMVWENQGVMRLHGAFGTMFGSPNSLSGKFLCVLPFVWYLFSSVSRKWKVLLLILTMFIFNILIFTASRTGYLSFLFMILYIGYKSRKKIKYLSILILFLIVATILIPEQYIDRLNSAFTGQEKEGRSVETRKELLKDSIKVFIGNPIGVGIGGFVIVQARNGRNAQETHNLYTQILSETGIQGLLVFSVLILSIFKELRRIIPKLQLQQQLITQYIGNSGGDITNISKAIIISNDLKILENFSKAVILFLVLRLMLGIFGHDLFEIYWWIAAGSAMAVSTCADKIKKQIEITCV